MDDVKNGLNLNQFSNSETKQLVSQELSKKVFPKNLCPHFDQSVDSPSSVSKRSRLDT